MEDKQVQDLAAEASFITEERERLIREQKKLQNSLSVLNHCKMQRMAATQPFTDQSELPKSAGTPQQTITVQSSNGTAVNRRSNAFAHAHRSNSKGRSGRGPFGNTNTTDGSTTNGAGLFGSLDRATLNGNSTLNPGINLSGVQQSPLPTGSPFMRSEGSVDIGFGAANTQKRSLFG
jgi:hypothetical protein